MEDRVYLCIDLKSFYASVECVERKLDPLTTNLVVADVSRTEKTICLAVSPSLKSWGINGRPRLFEVVAKVKEINSKRRDKAYNRTFEGSTYNNNEILDNNNLELSYIAATPRMALYIKYSAKIYEIYTRYVAPEDIHVYSIDEVFMDITSYLKTYKIRAKQLAQNIILDVLKETGITATAGIGTNLYLAKVAMDIVAKHKKPDENGVRIAGLDEKRYRKFLWKHTPLTDFWRVGRGYTRRLYQLGLYTMGDIARCSIGSPNDYYNEELLYKTFGINAELLIDHAWGYESCTMKAIKEYKPSNNTLGQGQVLQCAYTYRKARIVLKEMIESLVYEMLEKRLITNYIVIYVGYDIANVEDDILTEDIKENLSSDYYGRVVPKAAKGSIRLDEYTSSLSIITDNVVSLYDRIINKKLSIRRINISCAIIRESDKPITEFEQLDLFTDFDAKKKKKEKQEKMLEKERQTQDVILSIKKKYGKNAILKGRDLEDGATAKERNNQIGGHKA